MRKLGKRRELEKLNLIPILDAIFIFIFFLLMSAQFVDIYEIGTDAPAVQTTESLKDKTPPLNLVLHVHGNRIDIKTGLDEILVKTLHKKGEDYPLKELKAELVKIKVKHIEEEAVIIKPNSSIAYKNLVLIMDTVRAIDKKHPILRGKGKKGQVIETKELFSQVIFETII